jgi:hypothetical protein
LGTIKTDFLSALYSVSCASSDQNLDAHTKRQITKRQKLKPAKAQNGRRTKRQKAQNGRSSKQQNHKTA